MAIPYKRALVFDGGLPELRRTPQSPRDKHTAGFCFCAALRPSVRMRFRHVYQHFLQRHYHTSFRLPTPPLQPQPKHEIIPLYAGPQRPANA